jgi:hypothetical protein
VQQIHAALVVTRGTDGVSVSFAEMAVTQHAAYPEVAVGHALRGRPHGRTFGALVLTRLIDPQAKNPLHPWVTATALPADYGVTLYTLHPYAVYRVRMAVREAEVQQGLVSHYRPASV